jgi:hypothetical protein
MAETTTDRETSAPGTDPPPPDPASDGLADSARAVWEDLRGALSERARLLTLEARLAGLTLVQLVLYAVVVAVLAVTAWIGLMAGIVAALINAGMPWGYGIALGVGLNILIAAWLVRTMIAMVDRMDLEATLRRLQGRLKPPLE